MAKKIVILNGSPRTNGNTKELVKAFVKGAESAGNTVQVFDLQKMNIHGCLGCCMGGKDEASPCVQKDDMSLIYPAYREADVVVLAIGIRPATGFLQGSGIEMVKGAIVTDARQQTNLPDIYAVGDCAMVHNALTGAAQWSAMGSTANLACPQPGRSRCSLRRLPGNRRGQTDRYAERRAHRPDRTPGARSRVRTCYRCLCHR